MKTFVLGLVVVAGIMSSCSPKAKEETTLSGLNPKKFQAEIDGKQAGLYTLKNSAGMEVCITNFGGRIVSVLVPDKYGNRKDVVLGFDSLQIIGIYPVILAPLSVGMLTGLHREESKSMAKLFNCRRITMDIVYTVGRKVGNIRCMKPIRSMVRLSN